MDDETLDILTETDPEFAQAMQDGQNGQFRHTLLLMWASQLENEVVGYRSPPSIENYQNILNAWTFLRYDDVPLVRRDLAEVSQQQLDLLHQAVQRMANLPEEERTATQIVSELGNDWEDNAKIYLEVIVSWTKHVNFLARQWARTKGANKRIAHVVSVIATARALSPNNGLFEQMKWLQGFEMTDDLAEYLNVRTAEVIAELDEEFGDD